MFFLSAFHASFLFNSSVLSHNATVVGRIFQTISDQCFIFASTENVRKQRFSDVFSRYKNVTFAWMSQLLNQNATELLADVFKLFQANDLFLYPL